MTTAIGRESCGGDVVYGGALQRCLTLNRSTAWPRWWESDQTSCASAATGGVFA